MASAKTPRGSAAERRKKEIEERLQSLREYKHQLVQLLKQALQNEDEKRKKAQAAAQLQQQQEEAQPGGGTLPTILLPKRPTAFPPPGYLPFSTASPAPSPSALSPMAPATRPLIGNAPFTSSQQLPKANELEEGEMVEEHHSRK
eukprot:TRINITY_DN1862_c0_g3_i1.p1 TRINITY_DN1862_c0_g3~~TRINITY_DN1862_c0_g3_i1.p1  ORF type:complete len:160 (-),score=44.21 TRINITY_DN1862_c0_g3_i1:103-537(-)